MTNVSKKMVKLLGCLLGGLALLMFAVLAAAPLWHLTHRNVISFNGWSIPVPQHFFAINSKDHPSLWKTSFGMPFVSSSYGHITLHRKPTGAKFQALRDRVAFERGITQDASNAGYSSSSTQILNVAGLNAYCWKFAAVKSNKVLYRCFIDNSSTAIFYEGDNRYSADFLSTLQSMRPNQL
jgi:hypothetical protein